MRRLLAALLAVLSLAALTGTAAANPSGPDVASYQHPYGRSIAWGTVAARGSSFVFVKATEGTGYVNPYYARDAAQGHAAGLAVGAYHFARPGWPLSTATAQARFFVARAGGAAALQAAGELPPVLDLEVTGGLSAARLTAWARTWLATVQALTGRAPMVYTYPNFWPEAMGNTTALAGYPLWIASYSGRPVVLRGWKNWTFWQYTANAHLPGVPSATDASYFNGTLDQLRALANLPPSQAASNPVGSLDAAMLGAGALEVDGWAEDPDSPAAPLAVHAYLDGQLAAAVAADQPRPDVADAFPAGGDAHGYAVSLPAPTSPGPHTVCTYAINVGAGTGNPSLGCRTLTVPDPAAGDPAVPLTVTAAPGLVEASGWAADPAGGGPVDLQVSVDGLALADAAAGRERPDGSHTGFDVQLTATPGDHEVCAAAAGASLGCATVTVPEVPGLGGGAVPAGHDPVGHLDVLAAAPGLLQVAGWAADPDTAGPVNLHVYVDGAFATRAAAGADRPDVAATYPGLGAAHGFDVMVPATTSGDHQVCVIALNAAPGTAATAVGCGTVTVP